MERYYKAETKIVFPNNKGEMWINFNSVLDNPITLSFMPTATPDINDWERIAKEILRILSEYDKMVGKDNMKELVNEH